MTDNITLPRATVQQALEALASYSIGERLGVYQVNDLTAELIAALEQQAEPVYKDSTPHLHVGDSAFESWFQAQPFATQTGIKQISRDSYAAGMGDPLVVAAPQQQAEPVAAAPALIEALDHIAKTIERQIELIKDRAPGVYLDKRPVVKSLQSHAKRARDAIAKAIGTAT